MLSATLCLNFQSSFFLYLIYILKFIPNLFPTKHLLHGHIRIVQGDLSNPLCQSPKTLSLFYYSQKLVPCLFIQELCSTLLAHPLSITGLFSFSLGLLDNSSFLRSVPSPLLQVLATLGDCHISLCLKSLLSLSLSPPLLSRVMNLTLIFHKSLLHLHSHFGQCLLLISSLMKTLNVSLVLITPASRQIPLTIALNWTFHYPFNMNFISALDC